VGCEVNTWQPYPHPVFAVPIDNILSDRESHEVPYFLRVIISYLWSEALYVRRLIYTPFNKEEVLILKKKI